MTAWRPARCRDLSGPARCATLFVLVLLLAAGCDTAGEARVDASRADPIVAVDTGRVEIHTATDTILVSVEIAETPEQTTAGLMQRDSMPPDEGMLFLFTEPRTTGFWMFRTRIPLDIAFLDPDGRIVEIRQMEPCPSPNPQFCEQYAPAVPYMAALEVNRGFFDERGVGIGDRVERQYGFDSISP